MPFLYHKYVLIIVTCLLTGNTDFPPFQDNSRLVKCRQILLLSHDPFLLFTMTILLLESPQQIASKEAQNNEFLIETVIKTCFDDLTVYLFGEFIPIYPLLLIDFLILKDIYRHCICPSGISAYYTKRLL